MSRLHLRKIPLVAERRTDWSGQLEAWEVSTRRPFGNWNGCGGLPYTAFSLTANSELGAQNSFP